MPMSSAGLPIKKSVTFSWRGARMSFDVAQELFSSHQIDRGSRLLLESLDPGAFASAGRAADFGCGYGVLGIAWQKARPGWTMRYVDRDALAVAFARHNVEQADEDLLNRSTFNCDISLPFEDAGYDLVLWNVPGKAGQEVIAGLLDAVIDSLAVDGVLAAVVVHPLAGIFTEELDRRDVSIDYTERGKEHTVVHLRREGGTAVERNPFEAGLFDRPIASFSVDDLSWELTPVAGLPEYDSLNFATELTVKAMIAHQQAHDPGHWMVFDPGVGHLAVAATRLWPEARGLVYGPDVLAIRATRRALAATRGVTFGAVWGIEQLTGTEVDLLVIALPEQASVDDLSVLQATALAMLNESGVGMFHGRSTEGARLERAMRRSGGWRPGKPVKQRGSAVTVARRADAP